MLQDLVSTEWRIFVLLKKINIIDELETVLLSKLLPFGVLSSSPYWYLGHLG